ncbi:MAG: ROK family protein [Anaerolineae bacterium]
MTDEKKPVPPKAILAIDVGGTNIKVKVNTGEESRKSPSGPNMSGPKMVETVKQMTQDWQYDVISMGFPGAVLNGKIAREPVNLGGGWTRFDYGAAFGKPTRIINDAAMQALGSYAGGSMLFLGLGTGLGTAMVSDGVVEPVELGHMPYKKGHSYEDYIGLRGMQRLGKPRWRKMVLRIVQELYDAIEPDYVVLGGGNAKLLDTIPPYCRIGANSNAFQGGFRLWMAATELVHEAETNPPAPVEEA